MTSFHKIIIMAFFGLVFCLTGNPAYADCTNPAGVEGEQIYNDDHNVMQFCDGTDWTAMMGGGVASGVESAFTVVKTAHQTLSAGDVVGWDVALTNIGDDFDLSLERYIAPSDGVYSFSFEILGQGNTSTSAYEVYKNGVTSTIITYGGVSGSYINRSGDASFILELEAGDYIDIRAYDAQTPYGASSFYHTRFSGFKLSGSGHSTSMVDGWPDAIKCARNDGTVFNMILNLGPLSGGDYYYAEAWNGASVYLRYNSSGSLIAETIGLTNDCQAKSISTLYADGQAFNFVGSNGAGGSDDLGDHTATENIVLGTNYLSGDGGDEGLYIDADGNVGIGTDDPNSKLEIDGDILLSNSATTCGAAQKGAIRLNATDDGLEMCDGAGAWDAYAGNEDTADLTAAVVAFDALSCPAGWSEVTDLAGRMIIGSGGGYSLGDTGGAASVTLGIGEIPSHNHSVNPPSTNTNTTGSHDHDLRISNSDTAPTNTSQTRTGAPGGTVYTNGGAIDHAGSHSHSVNIGAFDSADTGGGGAHENRPPYRAYIYCKFNGAGIGGLAGDGLGDHTATENIVLGTNYLSGDGGDEGIYIDADGNVSIGTSVPLGKLHIENDGFLGLHISGASNAAFRVSNTVDVGGDSFDIEPNTDGISFQVNDLGVLKMSDAGDVGIGTNDPSQKLHVRDGLVAAIDGANNFSGSYNDNWNRSALSSGGYIWSTVGPGSTQSNLFLHRHTTSGYYALFGYGSTAIGTISTNGSTVAYNTTSDYRLKEDIKPINSALDSVLRLKPVQYNFKSDANKTVVDGFIAHEVQDVLPYVVIGEKDGVDEDGEPSYQQLDYGKLTPVLTKAIQELKSIVDGVIARVDAVFNRVATLESDNAALHVEVDALRAQNTEIIKRLEALESVE